MDNRFTFRVYVGGVNIMEHRNTTHSVILEEVASMRYLTKPGETVKIICMETGDEVEWYGTERN